jgi:hypothetical protein
MSSNLRISEFTDRFLSSFSISELKLDNGFRAQLPQ